MTLTGDHAPTAESVAKLVGIDEVRSELLPEDKLAVIEQLVARDGGVAMIGRWRQRRNGSGTGNLGVAIGTTGSDAAIDSAAVALMSDDLGKLAWLIRQSRADSAHHPGQRSLCASSECDLPRSSASRQHRPVDT